MDVAWLQTVGVIMGPSRAESSSAVKDRGLGNIARKYR
jgi:hypothetical protein